MATVAIAALGSANALAADMGQRPAYKAPVMMAPAPTWTGCYIGANIGGAFGNASATDISSGAEISGDGSGFAGGGQIGCDYQFSGGFVVGIRNMFDGTSNKKSGTFPATAFAGNPAVANFNNQWFDTLTARLGYTVAPAWLLYFQGGGAWAHTSTNVTVGGVQFGQTSNTRSGWTIGGGIEWMLRNNIVLGLEYDYTVLSGTTLSGPVTGAGVASFSVSDIKVNTVLARASYKFGTH